MIHSPIDTDKLKVEITIDTDNEKVLIKNLDSKHLYVELFNTKRTFGSVCWNFNGRFHREFKCNLEYKMNGV